MPGFRGNVRRSVVVVVAALLVVAPLSAWAQSLGNAQVVDVRGFSYAVDLVSFKEPRNISTGDGSISVSEMVRVVVRGQGFRPKGTGPVVWLNGIPTLRTQVAEDGSAIEAYFIESLNELEAAAARQGRWELIVQPHEGAAEVWRVSPSGRRADTGKRPAINRASE